MRPPSDLILGFDVPNSMPIELPKKTDPFTQGEDFAIVSGTWTKSKGLAHSGGQYEPYKGISDRAMGKRPKTSDIEEGKGTNNHYGTGLKSEHMQ